MIDALGASALDFGLGLVGQKYETDLSRQSARENREWQADMSGSAHQREVEDLKAAGLNPILSVNSGASTPGGATASAGSSPTSDFGGTALKLKEQKMQQEINDQNIATGKAQELKLKTDALSAKEQAQNTWLTNQILRYQLPNVAKESQLKGRQLQWDDLMLDYTNNLQAIDAGVNTAGKLVGAVGDALTLGKGKIPTSSLPPPKGLEKILQKQKTSAGQHRYDSADNTGVDIKGNRYDKNTGEVFYSPRK